MVLWCLVQGAVALGGLASNEVTVQIVATSTIFSLIGAVCSRNYPAPRLAMLLVLCLLTPLLVGATLARERWLSVLVLQSPLYVIASTRILGAFQQLAARCMKAEQDSERRARHDPLTGLLNRRALLDLAMEQDGRPDRKLALFALDLDGFKAVNDRCGHHAGDALLQAVARRLEACVRTQNAPSASAATSSSSWHPA